MVDKKLITKSLLLKLQNSLRGSALMVIEASDTMKSSEEKQAEMEIIEDLLNYIKAYDSRERVVENESR